VNAKRKGREYAGFVRLRIRRYTVSWDKKIQWYLPIRRHSAISG
jgi:hypothetical protein